MELLNALRSAKPDPATAVQEWIPLADIVNDHAVCKNGDLVGFIRIYPLDLSLMSKTEKARIVQGFTDSINAENESFDLWTIQRPVDLENYLSEQQAMVSQTGNPKRRLVLRDNIEHAVKTVASGSCVERLFYFIVRQKKGTKAEEDLRTRLNEIIVSLHKAGIHAAICEDTEIIHAAALFAAPQMTAMMPNKYEHTIMPLVDGMED